jgi:hypothetical protein
VTSPGFVCNCEATRWFSNYPKIRFEGRKITSVDGAEQTIKKYRSAMCIEAHELMTRGIPAVIQVTGLKQKVIDSLEPWMGQPTEILDQKSFGFIHHILYINYN